MIPPDTSCAARRGASSKEHGAYQRSVIA
jgi:hypothetical protein